MDGERMDGVKIARHSEKEKPIFSRLYVIWIKINA